MNSLQIEDKIRNLLKDLDKTNFIFNLLEIYDFPKSTISRLRKDPTKNANNENQIVLKNKFIFQTTKLDEDVHVVIDEISKSKTVLTLNPRFIIVTDFKTFLALDLKTKETVDVKIEELSKHYAFFLPWVGMEKAVHISENPADIKASYKMAKLYDQIISDNQDFSKNNLHDLNIFLSRLLFCFFAEDTNIFEENIFTYFVKSYTKIDGSDLAQSLDMLFEVLNTKDNKEFAEHFRKFPYVNGGLFQNKMKLPVFTKKSRDMIIECSDLNWKEINPDIFGSMIQAVVHPDQRENLGMHYTSVPNIMKVIEPLFLNDLNEDFQQNLNDVKKLEKLWYRLGGIQIFDPACGSGNFLIISFKELCKLEMKILERIQQIKGQETLKMGSFSIIKLNQFYGIEIDDFAHEMAILSLWLAQHQMNNKFKDIFGTSNPTLPLREGGKIVCGNSTRLNWEEVCPKVDDHNSIREIYIAGNPPYYGARKQDSDQKSDVEVLFKEYKGFNNLDYISCWFYKASKYIKDSNIKSAFVSTNSICQGEQVPLLWPIVLKNNIEIDFAYQSFKWKNSARGNAGVTCIIVGLRSIDENQKFIYIDNKRITAKNINPYLVDGPNLYIEKRSFPISNINEMCFGSMPNDGGFLLLDKEEYEKIISEFPESKKFLRRTYGGQEYIKGQLRYSIWINTKDIEEAMKIKPIEERVSKVKEYREKSDREATNKLSSSPYFFGEVRHLECESIIIPRVSSERREYIPIGFLAKDEIITDSANAVYNPEPWIFGIITSHMHMIWVRAVAGRLEDRLRYSSSLCYNTFPLPVLTQTQKEHITNNVYNILSEREKWPEKTMSELYDAEKMPEGLREAHVFLDKLVEKIYREKPFENDEERLSYLFKLYEEMINRDKLIKNETKLTKKKVSKK